MLIRAILLYLLGCIGIAILVGTVLLGVAVTWWTISTMLMVGG
jgi:hypothetical protein